jgi:hypothetical protein
MVAWFIIAIATLAVFALIAINGVQTVSATTDGVGRVETVRRMEAAVTALTARTGSPNNSGSAMVLAGTTVNGVYGLPTELSSFASTPFGQRIVYCPFGVGEAGTDSAVVTQGSGSTYTIQTKADQTGRVYVTDGRPNFPQVSVNQNLMAYLIAPRTKTSATPTCSSVRFNPGTNRFEAPDALVRPVIRSAASEDQRQQAGREVVYYVSPTGTGRGLAPNDPTSMYDAITYYRATLPQAMRIVMAGGNYVLPAQYMNATVGGFADKGNGGTLLIDGSGGAQLDFSGASDIWVPGNLELRNITISSAVGVYAEQGHKLTLSNTSTGFVWINNGGVLQASNVTITDIRLGWALYINDGSSAVLNNAIKIYARPGGNVVAAAGGSRIVAENAAITLGTTSGQYENGFYVEENTDMVFKSSSLTYLVGGLSPVYVRGGRATFLNTSVTLNAPASYVVIVQYGGTLALNGSNLGLGTTPAYGIVDQGASGFSGGTTTVHASAGCWRSDSGNGGVQFAQSVNVRNGSSRVTDDETPPGMSPTPTSAEVTANAAYNARNSQRAQLRNTNTSTYTCQI